MDSSVDEAYRRANPLLPSREKKNGGLHHHDGAGVGILRSDSYLPEYYDERDGGRDRRQRQSLRRDRSFTRRNTVADMETEMAPPSGNDEQEDPDASDKNSNAMSIASTSDNDDSNANPTLSSEQELARFETSTIPTAATSPPRSDVLHEFSFNPSAASKSKKWSNESNPPSKRDAMDNTSDNINDDTPSTNMFDPVAASSSSKSSSPRAAKKAKAPPLIKSPARALGDLGREQHGLFLVLHSDDIHVGSHPPSEVIAALKELYSTPGGGRGGDAAGSTAAIAAGSGSSSFGFSRAGGMAPIGNPRLPRRHLPRGLSPSRYSPFRAPHAEAILSKIVRIIQKHGDLIVWGTQELLTECGDITARLWRDGDSTSSSLIGAAMLNRAKILTDRGLVCSIKTRQDLRNEQKATAVISLIGSLARSCDPLCDQVSTGISGAGKTSTLPPLLRSDLKLPYQFTSSWHSLLLTLLAVPNFKAALANAYCDTYRMVTAEYAGGVGMLERSSYTLSVQFLNRVTYVRDLVRERNLLSNLSHSLFETLK